MGWMTEESGSEPQQKQDISTLSTASRPALGPPSLIRNVYQEFFPQGQGMARA
jgi:hypothetical protein